MLVVNLLCLACLHDIARTSFARCLMLAVTTHSCSVLNGHYGHLVTIVIKIEDTSSSMPLPQITACWL